MSRTNARSLTTPAKPSEAETEGQPQTVRSLLVGSHLRGSPIRALCYHGKQDIRCDTVPDPGSTTSAKPSSGTICGSDLRLYDGFIPGMQNGDILGQEFSERWMCLAGRC